MKLRLTVLMVGLLAGSVAFAAPTLINFSSLAGGNVDINGSALTFANGGGPGSAFGFDVTNCNNCVSTPAVYGTWDGTITGAYTIGAITTSGSNQTANVTGTGTFTITDATGTFSG